MIRPSVPQVLASLEALEDQKALAINRRHGDAHSVNLTRLRALAKSLGAQPELARALWATRMPNARLVALLVARPKNFTVDELDRWMHEAVTNKETDWLVAYLALKSAHAEALRTRWLTDGDARVESGGWALTAHRVAKRSEGLDLEALIDEITRRIQAAPERLQAAMNTCLGNIGVYHAEYRERVLRLGEELGVFKDQHAPSGCVTPYIPIWVPEMVRRKAV